MKLLHSVLWALTTAFVVNAHNLPSPQHTCVIPALKDGRDDAPAIREAFSKCGNNGKVVFQKDTTYSVQTALQLHNLKNVQVDLFGTLEVWKAALSWYSSVMLLTKAVFNGCAVLDSAWVVLLLPKYFHRDGILRRRHHD